MSNVSFADLGLSEPLLRALEAAKYTVPTPIQARTIPALLQGRDHALPDDVQALAPVVLTHRIVLAPEATEESGARVVADALASTPAL